MKKKWLSLSIVLMFFIACGDGNGKKTPANEVQATTTDLDQGVSLAEAEKTDLDSKSTEPEVVDAPVAKLRDVECTTEKCYLSPMIEESKGACSFSSTEASIFNLGSLSYIQEDNGSYAITLSCTKGDHTVAGYATIAVKNCFVAELKSHFYFLKKNH